MSKVLIVGYPLYGHMRVILLISKRLVEQGETVYFLASEKFKRSVEESGALFFPTEENHESAPAQFGQNSDDRISAFRELLVHLLQTRKKMVPILNEMINHYKIDYMIHDSFCSWGKMAARMNRLPAISSITTFAYNSAILEKNPEQFAYNVFLMQKNGPPKGHMAKRILKLMFAGIREFQEEGDDVIDLIMNKEEMNFVYSSAMFQTHLEEFDESYHFVGPCLEEDPCVRSDSSFAAGKKPLIYISLGTVYNHDPDFFAMCVDAFKTFDGQVVISTGNAELRLDLNVPEYIQMVKWAPQLELLREASLFITHGGFNSVNEALYYQVPVLVIPKAVDQFLVAERVEQLGVGLRLDSAQLTSSALGKAALTIMERKEIKENCIKVSETLRAAGGIDKIWDLIAQFKRKHAIV